MNRRIILTLLSGIVYMGLAGCAPAKSTWQRAVEAASPLTGKPAQPPVEIKVESGSDQQCQSVAPVEPGACYTPKYAGGALCQPQSIPYARCRTGSTSCQLGNTSPVQWFLCEEERGYTSVIPRPGSLMAIGVHRGHNITTGHTLYVEEVCPNPDGTYKLRVSHTNYDRRCHLEEDALVQYDPETMEADFLTGNWAPWGEDLPVQGFILQEPAPSHERHRTARPRPSEGGQHAHSAGMKGKGRLEKAPSTAKKANSNLQ